MSWRWLRWLNPLTPLVDYWRDRDIYAREERAAERAATSEMISGMRQVVITSLDAAKQNTALFERFLQTYEIAEPPHLRLFDEEEDDERYIKRKQQTSSMPASLAGLSRADQFKAILDNLDKFNAGD